MLAQPETESVPPESIVILEEKTHSDYLNISALPDKKEKIREKYKRRREN